MPNALTIFRVLAIPAVVSSFYVDYDYARYVTLVIFLLACATDFLDGYLARAWGAQSRFGRLFDPVADKLIVLSTFVMLVHVGRITGLCVACVVIVVCREVLVSGMREFLIAANINLPVSNVGKFKTVAQMVSTGVLIISDGEVMTRIGEILLWGAACLSVYSMYSYTRTAIEKTGI